jgi:hypothetical protein
LPKLARAVVTSTETKNLLKPAELELDSQGAGIEIRPGAGAASPLRRAAGGAAGGRPGRAAALRAGNRGLRGGIAPNLKPGRSCPSASESAVPASEGCPRPDGRLRRRFPVQRSGRAGSGSPPPYPPLPSMLPPTAAGGPGRSRAGPGARQPPSQTTGRPPPRARRRRRPGASSRRPRRRRRRRAARGSRGASRRRGGGPAPRWGRRCSRSTLPPRHRPPPSPSAISPPPPRPFGSKARSGPGRARAVPAGLPGPGRVRDGSGPGPGRASAAASILVRLLAHVAAAARRCARPGMTRHVGPDADWRNSAATCTVLLLHTLAGLYTRPPRPHPPKPDKLIPARE